MADDPDVFIAEQVGPPHRHFYISPENSDPEAYPRWWRFVCEDEGVNEPVRSTVEAWFFEILRYPPEYASEPLIWRREFNGQVVSLEELQVAFDRVRARPDNVPEELGLPRW